MDSISDILGFKKSIIVLPRNWRISSVPLWIGSYVKLAYKQRYSKCKKEMIFALV